MSEKDLIFEQLRTKVLAEITEKKERLSKGESILVAVEWKEECIVDEIVSELNLKGYTVTHSYCYLGAPKDGYHWLKIEDS